MRVAALLILLCGALTLAAATEARPLKVARAARSEGSYDNALIATTALRYVTRDLSNGQPAGWGGNACADAKRSGLNGAGSYPAYPKRDASGTVTVPGDGQCRSFVNCIVWMVSAHTQWLGGTDYFTPFTKAGGIEITSVSGLKEGDIVQVGNGTHTFIIVNPTPSPADTATTKTFDVVDSNHNYKESVLEYHRAITLSSSERAFRMGTVKASSSSPPPTKQKSTKSLLAATRTYRIPVTTSRGYTSVLYFTIKRPFRFANQAGYNVGDTDVALAPYWATLRVKNTTPGRTLDVTASGFLQIEVYWKDPSAPGGLSRALATFGVVNVPDGNGYKDIMAPVNGSVTVPYLYFQVPNEGTVASGVANKTVGKIERVLAGTPSYINVVSNSNWDILGSDSSSPDSGCGGTWLPNGSLGLITGSGKVVKLAGGVCNLSP